MSIFKKHLATPEISILNSTGHTNSNTNTWVDINALPLTQLSQEFGPVCPAASTSLVSQQKQQQDNQRAFIATNKPFLTYFLRNNIQKNAHFKNSLNLKLKQNVKLKKEIIDLLQSTDLNFIQSKNGDSKYTSDVGESTATSTVAEIGDEKLVIKERKLLLNELNKKENYLSENMNRNILALEKFMTTTTSTTTNATTDIVASDSVATTLKTNNTTITAYNPEIKKLETKCVENTFYNRK